MEGNLSLMATTITTLTLLTLSYYLLYKHTDKIEKKIDSILINLTKFEDKKKED